MEGFRRPGERPPRTGHRRSASASLATLVPVTLQASRERGELEVHAAEIEDVWLRKQATPTTTQAAAAAAPVVTAAQSPQASLRPTEQDAAIADMASAASLPPSDDEEAMNSSSSHKSTREAESEEDEESGRRKQQPPPTALPHLALRGRTTATPSPGTRGSQLRVPSL